jgi:hypothetical protein
MERSFRAGGSLRRVDGNSLRSPQSQHRPRQSVQSVSDCSVSSSVRLFCFSQSVEDYFRVSQSVKIKGISY